MNLAERFQNICGTTYENRLMIIDRDDFSSVFDYSAIFRNQGFTICNYNDLEEFLYEQEIRDSREKYAVILQSDAYVPYDIHKTFRIISIGYAALFPNLSADVLKAYPNDLELILFAEDELYDDLSGDPVGTKKFITEKAFSQTIVKRFGEHKLKELVQKANRKPSAADWIHIAEERAQLEMYLRKVGLQMDTAPLDEAFREFVFNGYQNLSSAADVDFPWMLPKVMDFIMMKRSPGQKTALLLIDGMSMVDYDVMRQYWSGISRKEFVTFAMIPTTTAGKACSVGNIRSSFLTLLR